MTPQEKSLLSDFLSRLTAAGQIQADPEAALLIGRAGEQQPGALYLAVQRAVWLEHALQEAQERIRTLEAAAQPPSAPGSSWLSSTWGSGAGGQGPTVLPPQSRQPPGPAAYPQPGSPQAGIPQPGYPQAGIPQPGYPQPAYGPPGYPQAGMAAPGGMFGGGSFLGGGSLLTTVATTAAGVAVGSLIAEALTPHHHQAWRDNLVDNSAAPLPLSDTDLQSTPQSGEDLADLGDFDGGSDDSFDSSGSDDGT